MTRKVFMSKRDQMSYWLRKAVRESGYNVAVLKQDGQIGEAYSRAHGVES